MATCPACGGRKTITVARGAQPAQGVRGLVFLPPSEVPCPCVARDAAEARVAELETGGGLLVLWWFLNDNPDQPMPPGASPCKQAIEAIQALRAERDRLAEIVERLPKCWRLNEAGELVQDVPVTQGMKVYAIDCTGYIQGLSVRHNRAMTDSSRPSEVYSPPYEWYETYAAAEAARAARGGTP